MGEPGTGFGPALRHWFTAPPRRHGELDTERTVGFLELFYDLVFVVLVGQLAHTLAEDASWSGLAGFAVVFGLVWIAWLNGSLYHELHGREDGRHRAYIFGQMLLLVLLATFAGHATEDDGAPFAITFAVLLAVLSWQWWTVRRYDTVEVYRSSAARYIAFLVIAIVVVLASIPLAAAPRLWVWAALVVGWVTANAVAAATTRNRPLGFSATESMAERFGLFTIIVLGEVVIGVVDGILEADRASIAVVTGLLALTVGFGFWWNYFDGVGRRTPHAGSPGALAAWMVAHLPLTAAIAAAGAGMVGLIEHAAEDRAPLVPAWLLAGASALLLALLAVLVRSVDLGPATALVPSVTVVLLLGSAASVAVGAVRPVAWLLALLLTVVHVAVWTAVFWLKARAPRAAGD
ncbi:low temperature requirement protein A [Actinotalea sp. M2MS4P-6]|uniref:low temperature requirement protein A n=1 Tax=Actinotalea sp. M2MS4P-6 TaxID=2983762 RepID=UPI0021E438AE|nr:low temperature requirement protein A [Actinotalea sp. M2MS4P-6]MCV2395245.1 low temperature requirement protein A [Actinotalea sp. M2MS4P-6]